MAQLNKVQNVDFSFRVEQLRNLCDDYLKNNSDEFYSEKEKVLNLCQFSQQMLEQATKEFKQG